MPYSKFSPSHHLHRHVKCPPDWAERKSQCMSTAVGHGCVVSCVVTLSVHPLTHQPSPAQPSPHSARLTRTGTNPRTLGSSRLAPWTRSCPACAENVQRFNWDILQWMWKSYWQGSGRKMHRLYKAKQHPCYSCSAPSLLSSPPLCLCAPASASASASHTHTHTHTHIHTCL